MYPLGDIFRGVDCNSRCNVDLELCGNSSLVGKSMKSFEGVREQGVERKSYVCTIKSLKISQILHTNE